MRELKKLKPPLKSPRGQSLSAVPNPHIKRIVKSLGEKSAMAVTAQPHVCTAPSGVQSADGRMTLSHITPGHSVHAWIPYVQEAH